LNETAAFWSYSHEDNALDDGALLKMSQRLRDEFALITGGDLSMFVDRDALEWGDEWRRRIDGALAATTFFIPVVTPRYFTREECRRELLTFAGRAASLGLRELVLPILYVDVPDLEESNSDEAKALVARMQYVDWRQLRLEDSASHGYRTAIHTIAQRLAQIASEVDERERERAFALAEATDPSPPNNLEDLVREIDRLLPEWLLSVEDDPIVEAENMAIGTAYEHRLARLRASNAPHSAILSTQIREARDLLPIAERNLRNAEVYAARTVELDPIVHAVVRLVEEHPESVQLVAPLRAGVEEAMAAIRKGHLEEERGVAKMSAAARRHAHISRLWRDVADHHGHAESLIREANTLVEAWASRLSKLSPAAG
jgi:hypothetical protein